MTPIKTAPQDVNHALNNVSQAANSAGQAIENTFDSVLPALQQAADQLSHLARQGMDSLRAGSSEISEEARRARQLTTTYIRNEPLKSVLMAVAIGAAAMALYGLLRKSHD